MSMELHVAESIARSAREAALVGDYDSAVAIANSLVPGMELQLQQYRWQMETYEEARCRNDWRRALRALADARLAAVVSGVPALEEVASDRLYDLVRTYGVAR